MQQITISLTIEQLKLLSYLVTSALNTEAIECAWPEVAGASDMGIVLAAAVETPADVDMIDNDYVFVNEPDED